MRYIITILLVFCLQSAISQVYQLMPQYGYNANRMNFDSTLSIPTTCGVPSLKSNILKKAAIAFDSCNHRFYFYDAKTLAWDTIKGGASIDTTSLSNRINLKVDSLKKSGDSVYFYKNGTSYFAYKDSIGTGQNGRWGNDTATIILAKVHNDAGSTLTNGEVVFLSTSGTNSDAPSVRRAINKADSTSANTFGFVKGNIAANDTGWVVLSGKIEKLNTSAFANGDIIYLDSIAGGWTKTKPVAPYHMVYLGVVIKSNSGNGSIFVKCQNGYELDEIHDVKINGKVNNQILAYSDTLKVWKNRNIWSVVDTSTWSNRINAKLSISDTSVFLRDGDSTLYQTKYRSDSSRTNIYTSIATKLNISDTSVFLRDSDSSLYQTKFRSDTARTNTYTSIAAKENILTFSTGLTRSTNTITDNLAVGISGGQSVKGGTAASDTLRLYSTTNATKGKIIFGTSAYDEANNRLGIGTSSPSYPFDLTYSSSSGIATSITKTQTALNGSDLGDGALSMGYTISGSGSGTELVSRVFSLSASHSYTSGTITNMRVFNLATNSAASTTTTNMDALYIENGTSAGIVTNYRGILINNTQGTSRAGLVVNSIAAGTNRAYVLLGTSAIPSGTWSIYSSNADKSYFNGNVLIGTTTDGGYKLDVNGTARANQFQLSALNTAPASATATGTTGEIRIVNGFIYVCVATNTWQRAAISTW